MSIACISWHPTLPISNLVGTLNMFLYRCCERCPFCMGFGRIWHFLCLLFHQHHKKRMLRILHLSMLYWQDNLYNYYSKQNLCWGSFSRPHICCTRAHLGHLWRMNRCPPCNSRIRFLLLIPFDCSIYQRGILCNLSGWFRLGNTPLRIDRRRLESLWRWP